MKTPLHLGCLRLIKRSWVFHGLLETFNRVFFYCLKYSNNYSYLKAVSLFFVLTFCSEVWHTFRGSKICDSLWQWGGGSRIAWHTLWMAPQQEVSVFSTQLHSTRYSLESLQEQDRGHFTLELDMDVTNISDRIVSTTAVKQLKDFFVDGVK